MTPAGVRFTLSNSATDFIKNEYQRYSITAVSARRPVNSVASKRGESAEVVIRNYE